MARGPRKTFIILTVASLCISLCGCQGLEYHDIYMATLGGAAIGAIVGYQSDECEAGAAVGAAVFAVGELLSQIDDLPKEKEREIEDAADEVARGDDLLSHSQLR